MKKWVLLSAVIGAGFCAVFYPTRDPATRVAVAVAFFLLLGTLFCTMPVGSPDDNTKSGEYDQPTAADRSNSEGAEHRLFEVRT